MNKYKETVGAHDCAQRGITLIALVITTIVMLILVAVTISMAINGGLFDYAGKATGDTKNAINEEQELANLQINMTVDELIKKYSQGSGEDSKVTFTLDGVEFTVAEGTKWMDWMKTVDEEELNAKGITKATLNFIYDIDSYSEDEEFCVTFGPPIGGGYYLWDTISNTYVRAGDAISAGGIFIGEWD